MPKILLLNASPSGSTSNSAMFLSYFKGFLERNNSKYHYEVLNQNNHEEIIEKIFNVDKLIIAIPMYENSLPSTLLELFSNIELYKNNHIGLLPNVYAIMDCDILSTQQMDTSTRILKKVCKTIGFDYGFTLKIGSSSIIMNTPLRILVIKLLEKMEYLVYISCHTQNLSTKIPIPKWLLIKLLTWHLLTLGKSNGLSKKDMNNIL